MANPSSSLQSRVKKATLGTAIEHQFISQFGSEPSTQNPAIFSLDFPDLDWSTEPAPVTGRAATTAAVELLLEKCVLGMPTRYSTTIYDDEGLNEVEAECLSWIA
jgi:hypothetical protein